MQWRAGLGFGRSCSGCSNGLAGTSQRSRMHMQTLHLREDYITHQYRLGYEQLGSALNKNDLVIKMGSEVNKHHQCALAAKKANSILGCLGKNAICRSRKVIHHFYSGFV